MPSAEYERRIQSAADAAAASGAFDNPAWKGRRVNLGDANDPDWWAKRKIRDEKIDTSSMSPTMVLRREYAALDATIDALRTEDEVVAHLTDYNTRVKRDWMANPGARVIAMTVRIPDRVQGWRERRGL